MMTPDFCSKSFRATVWAHNVGSLLVDAHHKVKICVAQLILGTLLIVVHQDSRTGYACVIDQGIHMTELFLHLIHWLLPRPPGRRYSA